MVTAAVVGAGPNGLAAAITLASAGVDVELFEANDAPGGAVRSSTRLVDGLRFDDYATAFPLSAASPFLRSIADDLAAAGLRWARAPIDLAHPLDDGRVGVLAGSVADTAAAFAGTGRSRAVWRQLFAPLADDRRRLDALVAASLRPLVRLPEHPVQLTRMGLRAALPPTWAAKLLHDESARALLIGTAAHAAYRLDRPVVGGIGLLLLAVGHEYGWPVPIGGAQAITDALVAVARRRGVRITTDMPIETLDQLGRGGRGPDVVLLDVLPPAAVALLGDRAAPAARRAWRRFQPGPAAFRVNLAVRDGIPWTDPRCGRAATLHAGGDAAAIVTAERQLAAGQLPGRPFLVVGQPAAADPGRIVDGVHPINAYVHVPNGWAGDAAGLAATIVDELARYAPDLRDRIVADEAIAPAALQRANRNLLGGAFGGGINSPWRLIARPRLLAPYATGASGVYLCSAATSPGGGVHGMCGANAAAATLAALATRGDDPRLRRPV